MRNFLNTRCFGTKSSSFPTEKKDVLCEVRTIKLILFSYQINQNLSFYFICKGVNLFILCKLVIYSGGV